MELSAFIHPHHLSHAYIIESERESGLSAIRELMATLGVHTQANPDYHEYILETLLLDDAHELRQEQGMHGADGSKKIFVVAFNSIIIESQNALLKTLEEPTANTHFFFLIRTSEILLPTVRSRMQLIRIENGESDILPLASEFLRGPISVRMKQIESMTKAKTDDKPRAKEEARVFVGALEHVFYKKMTSGDKDLARGLEDIIVAKRELSGRSPSIKLLLEHLALTLPVG